MYFKIILASLITIVILRKYDESIDFEIDNDVKNEPIRKFSTKRY